VLVPLVLGKGKPLFGTSPATGQFLRDCSSKSEPTGVIVAS
jgi:hypothetical protein